MLPFVRGLSRLASSRLRLSTCSARNASNEIVDGSNWSQDKLEAFKASVRERSKLVLETEECKSIVKKILSQGKPIGVDLEGLHMERIVLVQIKDGDGNVSLFHTGSNPEMLSCEGGIRDLLECTTLLKVFHASMGDCLGLASAGIKMWGLYDTGKAYKVIQYQKNGAALNKNMISLNNLCNEYGLIPNIFKQEIKEELPTRNRLAWRNPNYVDVSDTFLLYSAFDVEHLVDLYEMTKREIDEDFVPVLNDLVESEIVRGIDPHLVTSKQSSLSHRMRNNIFLSGFSKDVTKYHLYEVMAGYEGAKVIRFSPTYRTAHIYLSDRSAALLNYQRLSEMVFPDVFGENTKVDLVVPASDAEMTQASRTQQEFMDNLKKEAIVADPQLCSRLVDILIDTKCPVYVESQIRTGNVTAVLIFAGRTPVMKVLVSPEMITKGSLGRLFASEEVVKVVDRVPQADLRLLLRSSADCGLHAKNFFDISVAELAIDYWLFGQSFFSSLALLPSHQHLVQEYLLGDTAKQKARCMTLLCHHYHQILPPEILDFLKAYNQINVDLNSGVASAKEAKRILKLKYETNVVHVTCDAGKSVRLQTVLESILQELDIPYVRVVRMKKVAFVEVLAHKDKAILVRKLQKANVDGLVLTASNIERQDYLKSRKLAPLNRDKIDELNGDNAKRLEEREFYSLLKSHYESKPRFYSDFDRRDHPSGTLPVNDFEQIKSYNDLTAKSNSKAGESLREALSRLTK